MRVLRLDLSAGTLELHPFVTVARGLPPAVSAELVDVLSGIPAGRTSVTGLVEAHGVLLDLSPDSLDLLDLSEDMPVVVTAADLPAMSPPDSSELAAARAAARTADEGVAAAEDVLAAIEARADGLRRTLGAARGAASTGGSDEPVVPRAAVAAATRRREVETLAARAGEAVAAAEQELLAAETEAAAAREARAEATRAMSLAAAALDAATDRLDPVARAAVEAARQRVEAGEEAVTAVRAGRTNEPGDGGPDDADLEALRAKRVEAEAMVLALATPDPFPVRLALEQLGSDSTPVEVESSSAAIALADQLVAIEIELGNVRDRSAPRSPQQQRSTALKRVRSARRAVDDAEIRSRPGVEPAAAAILEAAHAEVVAARDAVDGRMGGRTARRRRDEAIAAERRILDMLGLLTYTDYRTGVRRQHGGRGANPSRLEKARQELGDAEAALRRLDDNADGELRRAELLQQRVALRAAAVELLGGDPGVDLEAALRRHRVPVGRGSGGADRLADALESIGFAIGDEPMPERFLVDLAKLWLNEQESVTAQRRSHEARVADLDLRIADRQQAEAEPDRATRPSLTNAVADLEEAKAALRSAEARAARHAKAEAEVEERRVAFAAASSDEAAAVSAVGAADAEVIFKDEIRRRAVRDLETARAALAEVAGEEHNAAQVLADLEAQVEMAAVGGVQDLEDELARCEADAVAARADVARRAAAAHDARAQLALVASGDAAAGTAVTKEQAVAAVENAEWYLLARLAAQRAVSYAGSVPLVLDDALSGFDALSGQAVLDRLERMAPTVQVVVITEDLSTAAWATRLGLDRAAVVEIGVPV